MVSQAKGVPGSASYRATSARQKSPASAATFRVVMACGGLASRRRAFAIWLSHSAMASPCRRFTSAGVAALNGRLNSVRPRMP